MAPPRPLRHYLLLQTLAVLSFKAQVCQQGSCVVCLLLSGVPMSVAKGWSAGWCWRLLTPYHFHFVAPGCDCVLAQSQPCTLMLACSVRACGMSAWKWWQLDHHTAQVVKAGGGTVRVHVFVLPFHDESIGGRHLPLPGTTSKRLGNAVSAVAAPLQPMWRCVPAVAVTNKPRGCTCVSSNVLCGHNSR